MKKFLLLYNSLNLSRLNNILDFILLVIAIALLMDNIIMIIINIFNTFYSYLYLDYTNMICMVNNTSTSSSSETKIIHDDGNWSNVIRTLFIYGTGALRLKLNIANNGSPTARAFIISGAIGADLVTKVINNTINDSSYIKNHYFNWKCIWSDFKNGEASVTVDKETESKITSILNSSNDKGNSFLPEDFSFNNIQHKIGDFVMDNLKPFLKPVTSEFSNEVLAEQIHDISVLLFVLNIFIIILIIGLLFNILILINSDRITNIFKNKYIKWYVNFNVKIIKIEVFVLGFLILYFNYTLSYGLHYLATHPIIIS